MAIDKRMDRYRHSLMPSHYVGRGLINKKLADCSQTDNGRIMPVGGQEELEWRKTKLRAFACMQFGPVYKQPPDAVAAYTMFGEMETETTFHIM